MQESQVLTTDRWTLGWLSFLRWYTWGTKSHILFHYFPGDGSRVSNAHIEEIQHGFGRQILLGPRSAVCYFWQFWTSIFPSENSNSHQLRSMASSPSQAGGHMLTLLSLFFTVLRSSSLCNILASSPYPNPTPAFGPSGALPPEVTSATYSFPVALIFVIIQTPFHLPLPCHSAPKLTNTHHQNLMWVRRSDIIQRELSEKLYAFLVLLGSQMVQYIKPYHLPAERSNAHTKQFKLRREHTFDGHPFHHPQPGISSPLLSK